MTVTRAPIKSNVDLTRLLVLWCPDWPVAAASAAAKVPASQPVAVVKAHRVMACSAVARAHGVRRGMRRREAESRCPELVTLAADLANEAQLFESVAQIVEETIVGIDVVRPGIIAVPVRGAVTHFGNELALVELLLDHVVQRVDVECQIGIAEGLFAATLAARRSVVVEPGKSQDFLAPLAIDELNQPDSQRTELVNVLKRLGLRTLGAFAGLAEKDVTSRFGQEGVAAYRLAKGQVAYPPHRRRPPVDLAVYQAFDTPVNRVDIAAFQAKTLAGRFNELLARQGFACTRLKIHMSTDGGEQRSRVWHCAEPLTPEGVAQRVRWQLHGWLHTNENESAHTGISSLTLEPAEIVSGHSLQLELWRYEGSSSQLISQQQNSTNERANRALVRVQALLGPDSVYVPLIAGGRGPAERVQLIRWGDHRIPRYPSAPWPGALPDPSPATVFSQPIAAQIFDMYGNEVTLIDRHEFSGVPHTVSIERGLPLAVINHSAYWFFTPPPQSTDPLGCARLQVHLSDATEQKNLGLLLRYEQGLWSVEGKYN